MTLKVLRREDGVMMKLTQYDVEEAKYDGYRSGSTNVVPEDAIDDNTDDREFNEKITYKKVKYGESYEEDRTYDIGIVHYEIDTINETEGYKWYTSNTLEVDDTIGYLTENDPNKFRLRLTESWKMIQPYAYKIYIDGKETDEFLLDDNGEVLITTESTTRTRYVDEEEYKPEQGKLGCIFTLMPIE